MRVSLPNIPEVSKRFGPLQHTGPGSEDKRIEGPPCCKCSDGTPSGKTMMRSHPQPRRAVGR